MRRWLSLVLFTLPVPGLADPQFEQVEFEGASFTVCRVDLRTDELRLFWKAPSGVPFKRLDHLAKALQQDGLSLPFACNAGMYHGDFSPVGLHIEAGREWSPLNLQEGEGNFFMKPNGVFALAGDRALVAEANRFRILNGPWRLATQSGPMLVVEGRIHPRFRRESTSVLFRNGVACPDPQTVLFTITDEPVNLHHFARFHRDALKCRDALYLDGTISSWYAPALKRNDFRMELGPIFGVVSPAAD